MRAPRGAPPVRRTGGRLLVAAVLLAITPLLITGCGKKGKVEVPQARSPIRLVLLPANVPSGDAELQWLATATPVLMAEAVADSPEVDLVPLWESMPVAKESVGDSGTVTEENAAYIASRMTARWATLCTISTDKSGISMLLDFIPSKPTLVPFRYEKKGAISGLNGYFREAFTQFLRYLVAEPLKERKLTDPVSLRPVGEAVNREYGWSVTAEPGKSEGIVSGFAQANKEIAPLIFNPNLYPGIGTRPAAKPAPQAPPAPASPAPAASPPAPSGGAAGAPPPAAQTPAAPPPSVPEPEDEIVIPPPKTFTQKISPSPPPEALPEKSHAPVPRGEELASGSPEPPAANRTLPPPRTGEFLLQVLATKGKLEADALIEALKKAGLSPRLETVDIPGKGTFYRIRLAGFESRRAAAAAGDKLVADGMIKEYWITR